MSKSNDTVLMNEINKAYTVHINEYNQWKNRGRLKRIFDNLRNKEEPSQAQLALDIADAIILYHRDTLDKPMIRVSDYVHYFGNSQGFAQEVLIAAGAVQENPNNNNILHVYL